MRKLLLCTPPYHTGIIEITGTWPPVGLLYVAGALKKAGYQVQLYDLMTKGHDCAKLLEKIKEWQPDAVLTGAFTPSINAAVDCLRVVKQYNPAIITVLGGVHATLSSEIIMTENHQVVDFIVCGEGEITCPQLFDTLCSGKSLEKVKGLSWWDGEGVRVNETQLQLDNLDDYQPAWDILDWSDYRYRITDSRLALINTSRGCKQSCRFCSQHLFWRGNYRYRSPKSVVEEIQMLNKLYGVQMCMIADEYPTFLRDRWEEILDRLIVAESEVLLTLETRAEDIIRDADILEKYRQAGVVHVYVGVESAHQSDLDYLGKNMGLDIGRKAIDLLNKTGIITECSFILGAPDETPEHIEATLLQAMEYKPDLAHFLLLTPWPYTELYNEVEKHIIERDIAKYHFVHPIIKPERMDIDELWSMLINCYRTFYTEKIKGLNYYCDSFKKRYMEKSVEIMQREFFQDFFPKMNL